MRVEKLIRKWRRRSNLSGEILSLSYRVHQTNITGKLQCFLIQNRNNFLIPFTATHYLSDYAIAEKSPQTSRNIAYALAYLYSFAEHRRFDLNDLISNGNSVELSFIEPLRTFVRSKGNPKLVIFGNTEIGLSLSETNRIMSLILGYLRWGLENYSDNPQFSIEKLERVFRNLRFSLKRKQDVRVLNNKIVGLLDTAFDLQTTPVWTNPLDRLRNNCIYRIAFETGARIAEILGLYIGDIGTGSAPVINFIKRDNNEKDSRTVRPRAKTFGRSLPISRSTHRKIIQYIQSRPGKNRNVFLFVSHDGETKGEPLSLRRAHALMEDVERHFKDQTGWERKANWHDIRHTALYRFYWQFKDRANRKDLLKSAAGHVSDSVYNRYHQLAIMEDVQKHLIRMHSREETISRPSINYLMSSEMETIQDLDELLEQENF